MIVRMKEGASKSSVQKVVRRAKEEGFETLTSRAPPFFVAIIGSRDIIKSVLMVFINLPEVENIVITDKPLEVASSMGLSIVDLEEEWLVLQ